MNSYGNARDGDGVTPGGFGHIRTSFLFACATALSAALFLDQACAQESAARGSNAHVYLFTGLLGVGSRLDPVITRVKNRGLPLTVAGPGGWSSSAAEAIAGYKKGRLRSIVIVGYSMGGGSALTMAAELEHAHVPVQLIVTVDPVGTSPVPPNVRRMINYYVPGGIGSKVLAAKNFHGSLNNIAATNPNLDHLSLARSVERLVFKEVVSAATPAAASKPATAPNDVSESGTKASSDQVH